MANDPMPTPNPYLDSQNTHFLEYAAKLTAKVQGSASSLTLKQGRHLMDLEDRPRHEPPHPDIETSHFEVETEFGKVKTFLYKPKGHRKHHLLPFIMHLHGGGFIQGEARDYNVFVFELVRRTGAAVMIPNYTLAPEKRFPTQQEQCLGVLQWVIEHGEEKLRLNVKKMVLTGDSAGGQLAPAVSILNHQRKLRLPIAHQVLFHPAVDLSPAFFTNYFSYFLFQNGPLLTTGFVNEVLKDYFDPKTVDKDRMTVTASPILMTPAQAKEWMPPTTIITAQADMIRDQGQQFAKLLQTSGVACGVVQEVACIHDCEFEDFARDSETSKLVMLMVTAKIKEVLIEPDMNGEQHGDAEDDDLNGQIGVVKGGSHKRKRRS